MGVMDGHEPEVWFDDEEPIATFFLKLPDTLSWRKGLPIREVHKIDAPLRRILEGTRSDPGGEEALEGSHKTYRDLTRANVLKSSILLHQVQIDLGAALGLEATMEALKLGGLDRNGKLAEAERSDRPGGGWCTIAEVAIPLQMMVAVRAAKEDHESFRISFPVEVGEGLIDEAFHLALAQVQRVQSMHHAVTRVPLTLVTPQVLPPLVPYLIRTGQQINSKELVEVSFYPTHSFVGYVSEPEELSMETVDAIFRAGRRESQLFAYLDLHRQASAAFLRYGNLREAVVMIAAAAEALFNIVLCHVQWEGGMTPEVSAYGWPDGLMTRVKTMYSSRIGGDWDPSGRGPVGQWAREVARVRNRIVHAGYSPSREEAERSSVVAENLLRYIGDRLVYGRNLRKYPRTASELLGPEGLERRNRYPHWLQALQRDPLEPLWSERFGSWYATQIRLLADAESPRTPKESRCHILAIFDSEDRFGWVARDPFTHKAATISVTLPTSSEDPISTLRSIQAMSKSGKFTTYPISIEFARSSGMVVEREGPWVEEYHLCPLFEVMADRSDRAAPWPLTLK